MTQPEALRLADELDQYLYSVPAHPLCTDAAAEMRRLHAENERLQTRYEACDKALRQWLDKTAWIQETGRGCELGMHRADAVRQRLSAVEAQRDALLEALKGMLHRGERNTCRHEETHRGGAIWEICDSCGAMWADDEGGKPEWEDPKEWTQARAAIKAVEEGK